ncbi:MAG: hypothetical protein AB7F65_02060 [Dehalococcoidia bacterium]
MPLVPNPIYWMVGEWLLRNGLPIVTNHLTKTPPQEHVLFEGEARLEHGPENITGLLSVTPSSLVFTPSGIRTRGAATALPLHDIDEVTPTKGRILGVIPARGDGLKVKARRGIFRFRVDPDDRDRWLREIRTAQAMAQPPTPTPALSPRDE